MKKSQIYSQVFVYVLAMLLVSMILVFGYKAISSFRDRTEKVACLKLKNDMTNAVDSILGDYGTIKKKQFDACSNYNQICFVESHDEVNLPNNVDPIIKDSILDKTGNNVFLVNKIAEESFNIGKISVTPDVMCLKTRDNKITIAMEGKGNFVTISQWVG